jgi:regulator of protease activity HflC (stomatin/prohibitin superfamily)
MRILQLLLISSLFIAATGCATMDIPQAYRGRMFERTGAWSGYRGGRGFVGPVLHPGTAYTGLYNEVMLVDCSTITQHDPLTVLTKDGVQFGLDMYVRFSANCADESVEQMLATLSADVDMTITTKQLFETFVRPSVGAVVREVVSPYRASEINDKQDEILAQIRKRFVETIDAHEGNIIKIYEVSLSNLDFPEAMDAANVDRAVQAILRDKAIAERERVKAEIETAIVLKELAMRDGQTAAARIDAIGEALQRHPEYLQYDLQAKMPEIYLHAGANGNMVITAPQPTVLISPKSNPPPPPKIVPPPKARATPGIETPPKLP